MSYARRILKKEGCYKVLSVITFQRRTVHLGQTSPSLEEGALLEWEERLRPKVLAWEFQIVVELKLKVRA